LTTWNILSGLLTVEESPLNVMRGPSRSYTEFVSLGPRAHMHPNWKEQRRTRSHKLRSIATTMKKNKLLDYLMHSSFQALKFGGV
jgi:hypothetical protein